MEKKKKKYYPGARRDSYLRNKDYAKQYYAENRDKIRSYQKERLAKIKANPEELEKYREYHRVYYSTYGRKPKKEER